MTRLNGSKITSANIFYEHIYVVDDQGNSYFLSPKELTAILSEFIFNVEQKRKRKHLHPVTPDVELLYNQEQYPS